METMGVRGFWGVEQLERMGLSTTRLSLLVMTGSVTSYYLLFLVFSGGIPNRTSTASAFFFGALTGLTLVATLAIARWTQADLESLLPVAPEIQPSIELLRPNRRLVLLCLLFEATFWGGLFYLIGFGTAAISVATTLQYWATSTGFFFGILLPSTMAASGTLLLVVCIRQINALTYAARHIDIDVLELDHYPRLATPLTRFVVIGLVLLSFAPTGLLLDPEVNGVVGLFAMPALVLILSMLLVAYAYPVWVLRGRIRAAKDRELDCVFRSLRGDEEAMSRSRISDRARSLSFSELLDYRIFIESLWDWPVAPHLQRVLLIGLLPPTTWVLAALIENAVSTVVGSG